MAEIRVNPTRMELKRYKSKLATARRGHKLLKDKCDELMKQFLDVVREDKELRSSLEKRLISAYRGIAVASAAASPRLLREALILPKREGSLTVSYQNKMSVTVPRFHLEILSTRGEGEVPYGMAFTSGEMDMALEDMGEMTEDLVRLAELEKTAQLLAQEIEKTRRRVNALEYIMIPQFTGVIRSITMKLDENERGNTTRLMKVKDMMVQEQIAARRREQDESPETQKAE